MKNIFTFIILFFTAAIYAQTTTVGKLTGAILPHSQHKT